MNCPTSPEATPMRGTLLNLATSLATGSIQPEQITFTINGSKIQDHDYAVWQLRQFLIDNPGSSQVHDFIKNRFLGAYVPNVIEWTW